MAEPGLRVARFSERDHDAGIQESAARSILSKTARAVRTHHRAAGRRDHPALQNSAQKRARRVARRYYAAAASADGGDQLLWPTNNRDRRPRLAAGTHRRANGSHLLSAV